jgi:hypothetical protein
MFYRNILKLTGLLVFTLVTFSSSRLQAQEGSHLVANRNVLSMHISDFLYTDFLMSYEHKNPKNEYGIYFPLAYSFGKTENIFGLNSTFYTGFGIHYYFADQLPLFFYTGPEIHLGMASINYKEDLDKESTSEDFFYTRLFVNGGFRYSPARNSSILVKLGAGIQYADYPNVTVFSETFDGRIIKNPHYYKEKAIRTVFNFSIGFGLSF